MDNIYYTIAEQKMDRLNFLLNEMEQEEIDKVIERELQKIKLIPLDMFSARAAINNIITAETSRNTIKFERTIPSLMSLDLTTVTTRSKFRFDNYYRRFYKSRNRGFDFEGMIAGLLNAKISEDKGSPFDITTSNGENISLKTLNNDGQSVVIKSVTDSLKTYYKEYDGTPEFCKRLKNIFSSSNPIGELVSSKNKVLLNIAEDVVELALKNIHGLLIGVPLENNKISLYYFNKEKLVKLSTNNAALGAPKISGSKQIRLSSSILSDADMSGTIVFPNLTNKDYEDFLIGDETTTRTIDLLNGFGKKYGINGLGGQLPQDIVMDLAKSEQFITDMNFIIGGQKEQ
jgi:hypothetical protein